VRHLVETVVRELVDEPARVVVEERTAEGVVRLSLGVARADRGRVIGRNGRTADALRTLLDCVGRQRGLRVELEVLE